MDSRSSYSSSTVSRCYRQSARRSLSSTRTGNEQRRASSSPSTPASSCDDELERYGDAAGRRLAPTKSINYFVRSSHTQPSPAPPLRRRGSTTSSSSSSSSGGGEKNFSSGQRAPSEPRTSHPPHQPNVAPPAPPLDAFDAELLDLVRDYYARKRRPLPSVPSDITSASSSSAPRAAIERVSSAVPPSQDVATPDEHSARHGDTLFHILSAIHRADDGAGGVAVSSKNNHVQTAAGDGAAGALPSRSVAAPSWRARVGHAAASSVSLASRAVDHGLPGAPLYYHTGNLTSDDDETNSASVEEPLPGGGAAAANLTSLPSYSSTSFVRAYVSDVSLNLEPAVIVSGLAAALNMVVVYFLQNHVLDTRDHLGLFLIGSYLVFSSYYMIYYFLERFSSSFRRISSPDKKFYIIGNLLKAGILISITPFAFYHLIKIIVFDEWEGNILRNLGCIYAIPDFISMIIVKRMRWSTWMHHLCVVVFNYFGILNDYRNENVCRCLVVYASFSSFAYCVNVLLASRFLGVSPAVARVLSFIALVVYVLCCAINWSWQVYYLRRLITRGHDHWTVYVYMCLISLVLWDDIVLNKWLLHNAKNNTFAATQQVHQLHRRQQRQQQQQQPVRAAAIPHR